MDLFHRLIIVVAVLCCFCRCQMIEREEAVLILKNIFDRQTDIMQKLQDMEIQINSTKQEMDLQINVTREEVQNELREVQSGLTEVQSGVTGVQTGLGLIQDSQDRLGNRVGELHNGQKSIQGSQRGQDDKVGGLEMRMGRFENALESSQQKTVSSFKSVLIEKLLESRQHLGTDWTSKKLPQLRTLITGSTSDIKNTVSGVTTGVNGIKDRINSLEANLKSSQSSAATDITNKITEATKKIKGLMGRVYCLSEGNTHHIRERCYFFSPFKWTWSGAKGYCQKHGGHLAKITSDEQFKFVKDKSGGQNRWLGLSDTASEGTYKWSVDGSSHDPSSKPDWWAEGEPNNANGSEDCIEYRHSKKLLNDGNCSDQKQFVCQFEGTGIY